MAIADDFLALSRQLYPTGRAFWMPKDSFFESLTKGLNGEKIQFFNDAKDLYDSIFPDNINFNAGDCAIWERVYGLEENATLTLDERKSALLQAMSFPGQAARQHYLYIENELQTAGFNVYLYENIFSDGMGGYITKTPEEITGNPDDYIEHGDFEHGTNEHGGHWPDILANSISKTVDASFGLGTSDLSSTFFVGGSPLGTYANVPAAREQEFRQLILKLKPVQNVGFLFINYV